MIFSDITKTYNIESSSNLVDSEFIDLVENRLKIKMGNILRQYILEYGYMAYKYVELYGVNSRQQFESDMIKQTEKLVKYNKIPSGYIAIENQGDGDYYLVNENDKVYEYNTDIGELVDKKCDLIEYIYYRFSEVNKN